MIERIFIKELLTFDKVILEPSSKLNLFTGPSGAGKSVLLNSMLSLFSFSKAEATHIESTITNIINNSIDEDETDLILKVIKKEKVRYFLNDSQQSKSSIKDLFSEKIKYISHKNIDDISQESLLELLDLFIKTKEPNYEEFIDNYKNDFKEYQKDCEDLKVLEKQKIDSVDKREFVEFEIEKLNRLNPKNNEYEKLLELKKKISKREKITQAINDSISILELENRVITALDLIGKDCTFFVDSMNELRAIFETTSEDLEELESIDIEEILNRIEELSAIIKKYGSIDEAILYLNNKKIELLSLKNIDEDINKLKKIVTQKLNILNQNAKEISKKRFLAKTEIESKINLYLKQLKLSESSFELTQKELSSNGLDKINFKLLNTSLDLVSSGEFNRIRLAILATRSEIEFIKNCGVLFLDEIDANVSGEEAEAIGKVLKVLSNSYQIFAISHQSQLTSKADKHFFVSKENNQSFVKELDLDARVNEIARMISGEKITQEAILHSKKLLNY